MLATSLRAAERFTRRDAVRLVFAAVVLVGALTAILAAGLAETGPQLRIGEIAPTDIRAPGTATFESAILTDQARRAAREAVEPVYDYSFERADLIAQQQARALRLMVAPVDAAFAAFLDEEARRAALAAAIPGLSEGARATIEGLDATGWATIKAELTRVLDAVERAELRDTAVAEARAGLATRFDTALTPEQRQLGAEILAPLVFPNSSYDAAAHEAARVAAAQRVAPVTATVRPGEIIVDAGHPIEPLDFEKMEHLGLLDLGREYVLVRLTGWFLLAGLVVGLLLAWIWRFRPEFWHRNNALILIGLILVVTTLAVGLTSGRSILPFFVPTAAAGMLVAILLDASTATVLVASLALLAGAANGASLELAAYSLAGGLAGIVAVRRGDRFGYFARAGVAVLLTNVVVVAIFSISSGRDLTGVLQLSAASGAAAAGSAVAAVGLFAILGNVFGITTVFQLLELANPSQPLLRRLLVETPGTYHHSLMVGNLAERAAEAIGADALLTRVAAYYHDIGKLKNPLAFIENQAGGENVHDQLEPEVSVSILKEHVADGIDLAYQYGLPKALIAFIPQHHGTATMSYFLARAREQAGAGPAIPPPAAAAAAAPPGVDVARFRHAGPKPQSREAALLMLADGVEASVRSLTSHEEPAIRAMVSRIIQERLEEGQFDECDLTFRDLERIREAFVAQLLGMYHRRVEYPQNKIVELESRRAAGGGPGA